jgi:hypothetical protein
MGAWVPSRATICPRQTYNFSLAWNLYRHRSFGAAQLFAKELDCDEGRYNNCHDDRRAYHGVGRQADIIECLTKDVRDEAGQTDGPEDRKGGAMSGSSMIGQCATSLISIRMKRDLF